MEFGIYRGADRKEYRLIFNAKKSLRKILTIINFSFVLHERPEQEVSEYAG